jgi:type IV pilus assembly protein PilW
MDNKLRRYASAKGVTLVEMMVSVALGLLLMASAIGIFVSSRQVYRTEEALSRNQENGRVATDFLTRKVREAGYAGCGNLEDIKIYVMAKPPPAGGYDLGSALVGYEGDGSNGAGGNWDSPSDTIAHVPGTDILTIRHGGECGADLTGNMRSDDAEIQLSNATQCGFEAGDYLLITDCQTGDLFRASSVSATQVTKITIAHANNVNTANKLSKIYQSGSTVLRFVQTTYFIGTNSDDGNISLYRIQNEGDPQELIENIEDMQLDYGVDSGNDGIVDFYRTASAVTDWDSVLSVRLNLLVRSDDNVTTGSQQVKFYSLDVNAGENADRRLRTAFSSMVTVRNRVP